MSTTAARAPRNVTSTDPTTIESVPSTAVKLTTSGRMHETVKTTCPLASLVPGEEVVASGASDGTRPTCLPSTGSPLASFNVTVTVDVATPSAATDDGDAVSVDNSGEGPRNVTSTDPTTIESVPSTAVKLTTSGRMHETVKTTCPLASLVPGKEVVASGASDGTRPTCLPSTGSPLASFNVTVTVDVATPSPATDDGEATIVVIGRTSWTTKPLEDVYTASLAYVAST